MLLGVSRAMALVAVATTALAGCGDAGGAPALTVTESFHDHLRAGDSAAACGLLAPSTRQELESSAGKPCSEALPEEQVPTDYEDDPKVSRFGSMAQVRYAGEVVFLGRFPDGWLVTAAGCVPAAGEVYECKVKGR